MSVCSKLKMVTMSPRSWCWCDDKQHRVEAILLSINLPVLSIVRVGVCACVSMMVKKLMLVVVMVVVGH